MHTPGPWTVRHDFRCANGEMTIGVASAAIGPHAGAVAWPCGKDDATEIANARLIAAAPEMLRALQRLTDLSADDGRGPSDDDLAYALKVIRTATGAPRSEQS
ncbi:MAG: hypothetical protein FGM22_10840 [Burkholderiaceae bacterium]|nr:hypothetical protein [Burkholderiaceae bacterium]